MKRALSLVWTILMFGLVSMVSSMAGVAAKSIPDKYQWVVFAVAATVLAIWNTIEWYSQRRLQPSHKYLIPSFALAIIFCFV
jgi:hypothetical protein